MGYTRLIMTEIGRGSVDTEMIRTSVGEIYQTAKRSSELTRQRLSFNRSDVLKPTAVGIDDSIDSMRSVLRNAVPPTVDILVSLRAAGNRICIDPFRLEQVVLNLVMNARDAIPKGGSLALSNESITISEDREVGGGLSRRDGTSRFGSSAWDEGSKRKTVRTFLNRSRRRRTVRAGRGLDSLRCSVSWTSRVQLAVDRLFRFFSL